MQYTAMAAHHRDRLNGGHESADERGGSFLHRQPLLALAAVRLPPRPQPLLLQRLTRQPSLSHPSSMGMHPSTSNREAHS